MAAMKLATWNINSVRLRIDQIAKFADMAKPDVICPAGNQVHGGPVPGQGLQGDGLSPCPCDRPEGHAWRGHCLARSNRGAGRIAPSAPRPKRATIVVKIDGVEFQNYYIPAGGDEPDVGSQSALCPQARFPRPLWRLP